jgi:hypothetical protein
LGKSSRTATENDRTSSISVCVHTSAMMCTPNGATTSRGHSQYLVAQLPGVALWYAPQTQCAVDRSRNDILKQSELLLDLLELR